MKLKKELIVDKTMLPEPFTGDLETANLVCLKLNPGKSNDDALFKRHRRLLELTQQTLKHQLGYSMWFEEIKTDKGKLHPEYKWWRSHTKSLYFAEHFAGGHEKRGCTNVQPLGFQCSGRET